MDSQYLINALLGVVLMLVGGLVKVLWDAVKTLQFDIQKLEVSLPTNYVAKDEFKQGMQEIKDMLMRVLDKLDAKVDK